MTMKLPKVVGSAVLALSLSLVGTVAVAAPDRPWMDWDLKGEIINV
ncbi:uncharacterized protein METZ01_LOCUS429284, partial [marine metagenome]